MKLTTVTTALKNNTLKMLAGAALAGALLTAAPAAQAQRVFFGVHVGGPVFYGHPRYFAPPPPVLYGRPGFYAPRYDWRYHHIDRFGHRW